MKNFATLALLALAGWIAYKLFNRKNDLQVHLEEQKRLMDVGDGVTRVHIGTLDQYPLTSVGDTPLAGIVYDPFNPNSIASESKSLETFPGMIYF
jgi:hypothetical protein